MTLGVDRRAVHAAHRELLADTRRLADALAATPDPPAAVTSLLAGLAAFDGVPFGYLVADETMLPPESIRFFQVDPNWVHALLNGAVSVGVASSADAAHDTARRASLRSQAIAAARRRRTRATSPAVPQPSAAPAPATTMSGFLLRSAVVSGWPSLEVAAHDADGAALTAVRLDVLTPATLLCVVDGLLASVDIHEPSEGLHFGLDLDGGKTLRYITVPTSAAGAQPGSQIPASTASLSPNEIATLTRAGGVLQVAQLASTIRSKLDGADANNGSGGTPRPFTAAELALQLVEGAQSVVFTSGAVQEDR